MVNKTVPATSFDSVVAAGKAVGVNYDECSEEYGWQLREDANLSDGNLSQWAGKTLRIC